MRTASYRVEDAAISASRLTSIWKALQLADAAPQPVWWGTVREGATENRGEWRFVATTDGTSPRMATQTIDRSTPEQYDVLVRVHCSDSVQACRDFTAAVRAAAPPAPGMAASAHVRAQWRAWILHEPCTPGPQSTPTPRYPPEAMQEGITGIVRLRVLMNGCGVVRHAEIAVSSGHRALDRAARDGVLGWRLPHAAENGVGVEGLLPVRFELPD